MKSKDWIDIFCKAGTLTIATISLIRSIRQDRKTAKRKPTGKGKAKRKR